MKALIFLILIVLVVSVVIWKMRKSRAEEDLARRKFMEHRREQEKQVISSKEDTVWPTIIRTVKGDLPSSADSETAELSMTAVEFVPSEDLTSQEGSSAKAGAYK